MPRVQSTGKDGKALAAGVYLLFGPGLRADRDAIFSAVDAMPLVSITHDPGMRSPAEAPPGSARETDDSVGSPDILEDRMQGRQGGNSSRPARWCELMLSGMTFDLLGLAPGPSVRKPEVAHRFNCATDLTDAEAIAIVPGPHLADGANSLPIVRAMLDLACGIARNVSGVETVCWSPARTAIAMPMFCKSIDDWLSGGAFPALGLTGFAPDEDGALASEGLSYFLGQELSIAPELSRDKVAATKLGARLVHDLVSSGSLKKARPFATHTGGDVMLTPIREGRVIEVTQM